MAQCECGPDYQGERYASHPSEGGMAGRRTGAGGEIEAGFSFITGRIGALASRLKAQGRSRCPGRRIAAVFADPL